ncbi:RagB/SusD family nutrient uptake outer membrane protein [Chitinophaga defluvii]|uniref:RagB/SusD family nutrient uptake outer membrane protein n=1 Tax=Chitinophaga defluvii TaxID=3163343 RepID=A0ABV2TCD4_9BACT
MKTTKHYLLIFTIVTSLISCKKFVEIGPPQNLSIAKSVFQNNETANSAMINIYIRMMEDQGGNPYRVSVYTGLSGDELKNYSNQIGYRQLYNNVLEPISAITNSYYSLAYNCIYQANAIIEGCQESSTLSSVVKNTLTGEALFIRAYWHFYLVNLYGDIPLVLTTDYTKNSTLQRSNKSLIYEQIVSDLKAAQNLLSDNYVGPDVVTTSLERIRPNKAAVTALMSRVYLFKQDYMAGEKAADAVLAKKDMYDIVPLNQVFLKNSKEAIWQMMKPNPNNQNINTYEGRGYILTTKPTGDFNNSTTIGSGLMSAFETGDLRKQTWIGKFTDITVTPNVDYYFPYKYKVKNGSDLSEYSMIMRVGEQYLIRAECRLKNGNRAGAVDDLDVIRKRAGLTPISILNPNISNEELMNAILKERQVELFTEQGHRWLDLKRSGKIDQVMIGYSIIKGSTWHTAQQLWPFPQTEILNNPNLKQNPGY